MEKLLMATGRPRKEISKDQFEKLCSMQCTEEEMCGFFGVCEDTLNAWCKRTYNGTFSEVYKNHSQDGKISLRRTQFKLAERSPAMAIWLGKQYLGQTDKIEQTNIEVDVNYQNELNELIKKYAD